MVICPFAGIDTEAKIVYAYVTHFSDYAIFYVPAEAQFNTKTVYPTKNPFIANMTGSYNEEKGTMFKIDYDPTSIATFRLEVFTLRGIKIYDVTRTNSHELYWEGVTTSKDFMGSGLYIYRATVTLTNGEVINTMRPIGVLK